jgi:hypothetical protein
MKVVTALYNENYKSLKKETNKDIRRWKDIPCSWISRINIVKMTILLKAIYMFNANYQNSNDILHQDREINLKVHMEVRKTSNSQSNPEPDFKLYYRDIVKIACYWHENRHKDQ